MLEGKFLLDPLAMSSLCETGDLVMFSSVRIIVNVIIGPQVILGPTLKSYHKLPKLSPCTPIAGTP